MLNQSNVNNTSEIQFPIDNTETNFMILESNLGIHENLQNIAFLEFDLDNTTMTKDHIKYFREVNNNFVEKEIHFVLNVKIYYYKGNCTWEKNIEKGFKVLYRNKKIYKINSISTRKL